MDGYMDVRANGWMDGWIERERNIKREWERQPYIQTDRHTRTHTHSAQVYQRNQRPPACASRHMNVLILVSAFADELSLGMQILQWRAARSLAVPRCATFLPLPQPWRAPAM